MTTIREHRGLRSELPRRREIRRSARRRSASRSRTGRRSGTPASSSRTSSTSEPEVLPDDRCMRVDGNSAFGSGFGLQAYPKASASYVLSDEAFYPGLGRDEAPLRRSVSRAAPPARSTRSGRGSPRVSTGSRRSCPRTSGTTTSVPRSRRRSRVASTRAWISNRLTTTFTYYTSGPPRTRSSTSRRFRPQRVHAAASSRTSVRSRTSGIEIADRRERLPERQLGRGPRARIHQHERVRRSSKIDDPSLETTCRQGRLPAHRAECNAAAREPERDRDSVLDQVEFVEPGDPDFAGRRARTASHYLYGLEPSAGLPEPVADGAHAGRCRSRSRPVATTRAAST